jgi:hypothetical protein
MYPYGGFEAVAAVEGDRNIWLCVSLEVRKEATVSGGRASVAGNNGTNRHTESAIAVTHVNIHRSSAAGVYAPVADREVELVIAVEVSGRNQTRVKDLLGLGECHRGPTLTDGKVDQIQPSPTGRRVHDRNRSCSPFRYVSRINRRPSFPRETNRVGR